MSHTFQAIFDQGVLRPLEPLDLLDQQVVVVTVAPPAQPNSDAAIAAAQRESLLELVESLQSIVDQAPGDSLTGRDHDRVIYGE